MAGWLLLLAGCAQSWCERFSLDCDWAAPGRDEATDADHDVWTADVDCDDTNANVYPDAPEACDGLDNDCDGAVDEGFEDTPWRRWYADADGDGYGDAFVEWSCEPVEGGSDLEGDCDDVDATIHPGAPEICDGLDYDCDGQPAPCAPLTEGAVAGPEGDDVVILGQSVAGGADLDGDGSLDLLLGAPDFDGAGVGGGALFAWWGPVTPGQVAVLSEPLVTGGLPDSVFGWAVDVAGDLDGDGFTDLVAGAPNADVRGEDTGRAYIFLGPFSAATDTGQKHAVVGTSLTNSKVGAAVAGAGDLDGDGWGDLLVGAPDRPQEGGGQGAAYVFLGPVSGEVDVHDAALELVGSPYAGQGGEALEAVGDLDGDGLGEIAVGAPTYGNKGPYRGSVLLLWGPITASAPREPDLRLVGSNEWALAGGSIAGRSDLDGDGLDDLVVTEPRYEVDGEHPGAVHLVAAPVASGVLAELAAATLVGTTRLGLVDADVATGGDFDGDGQDDLVVGAREADEEGVPTGAGTVYVVPGPLLGASALDALGLRRHGVRNDESAGNAVTFAGDLDGDGLDDVLVGARRAGDNRTGGAYVIFGAPFDP